MPPTAANPQSASARATRRALLLTLIAGLALALLAAVSLLALRMHFESRDRAALHVQLERARHLLSGIDTTGALYELPARLGQTFGNEPRLAVRVQGPLGQPLYEQAAAAAMPPALLEHPASAPPAPLLVWHEDRHFWRGSSLVMRLPLDGAAPLTVAMALDAGRDEAFLRRFTVVLAAYVLAATLAFALIARWLLGRAAGGGVSD